MTVDHEIRFELEHLSTREPGRLELTGRWFGIRGRRFVRPTLLFILSEDDSERRCLADLEHKPWAAEEGQPWTAVFPVDTGLRPEAAASIELSVAPDITVRVGRDPGPGARRRRARDRPDTAAVPASPSGGVQRAQRSTGEKGVERERVRRKELIAERDQAIAERDQATAMRDHATAQRDRATAERDRAIRAGARAETALRERDAELERTHRALTEARAESDSLRAQLTKVEARERRPASDPPEPVRAPVPTPPTESPSRSEAPHSERPRNPSLRSRANWFVRALTVLVMLGVIAAILEVVRMTIHL